MAKVPAGALGPRLVSTKSGQLLVWAVPEGEAAGLYSAVVTTKTESLGVDARRVASVDQTARQLHASLAEGDEVAVTMVHRVADNDVLTVTRLGPEGEVRGEAVVAATTPGQVLYSQAMPSQSGAVVVWVEKVGRSADLYSVVFDNQGPRRPTRLVRGTTAWQVMSTQGGLLIVTREGGRQGNLVLRQLGDDGRPIGAPVELARDVVGASDLDVAATKDHILVAWSEEGAYETVLTGTLLDSSGNVLATPAPLTVPRGDQALLGLLSPKDSLEIWGVWQEPRHGERGKPLVFLGPLDHSNQTFQERYSLETGSGDALLPAFAGGKDGIYFLSEAPCRSTPCGGGDKIYGRFPLDGSTPHAEPLRTAKEKPIAMAWDLQCDGRDCRFLFAEAGVPAAVHLAVAEPSSPLKFAVQAPSETPAVVQHETVGEVPELSRLVAGQSDGGGELLAWVSYFDPKQPYVVPNQPAPDGRRAPLRARLATQVVGAGDQGMAETVISYRARSLGEVSLVPPKGNQGLLAWAALDGGQPQLFATLIDRTGKKKRQKMLTRAPGEITDVAAARVAGGYLIAWVDQRDGRSEVYAIRVNDALIPTGKPRRVSHGSGAPSGVALMIQDDSAHCTWADARSTAGTGNATLYTVELSTRNAEPQGTEKALTKVSAHSHSPQLFRGPDEQPWVAWVSESGVARHGGQGSTLRFAALGEAARQESPLLWELPGRASAVTVDCVQRQCRVVAVVSNPEGDAGSRVALYGAVLEAPSGRAELRGRLLLPLGTRRPAGVSPFVIGENLYFADRDERQSSWRLRRAQVSWSAPGP